MDANKITRILILGGGSGGVYTAMYLERTLARDPNVEIILINQDNFFLFTPMLHEIAACDLDITHIVNPIRKLLKRVQFFAGDVESIGLRTKEVVVSHGSDRHTHVLAYDHIVLGMGAVTNFFGDEGLEKYALTMKTLGDAIHLRNQVIAQLEEADSECAAANRDLLVTFVVAGGGFAGVETMAAINDFVRQALPFYSHIKQGQVKMILVHAGDTILPELGAELGTSSAN